MRPRAKYQIGDLFKGRKIVNIVFSHCTELTVECPHCQATITSPPSKIHHRACFTCKLLPEAVAYEIVDEALLDGLVALTEDEQEIVNREFLPENK